MTSLNVIAHDAKKALLRRRAKLQRMYVRTSDEANEASVEREPDWLDRAVDAEAATVLNRLGEAERAELEHIDAALNRMDEGKWGHCEVCGGAIGGQRLRALPETTVCVSCSVGRERR